MADNKKEINCPACGNMMKKVFMQSSGVNLDVCVDGCGGIYFDNRELDKFDENSENIDPLIKIFEGKEYSPVESNKTRICPVCRMKMVKNYSSVKKEVEIDECYGCGGKFLDYGELEKIRAEYNTTEERAADVVKNLYAHIGEDLREIENKYSALDSNSSFLSKFIKIKY